MAFVNSTRGAKKFVCEDNFVYVFSKKTADEKHAIWVCERRGKCKGRVWTAGNAPVVSRKVVEHNHATDAVRPVTLRVDNGNVSGKRSRSCLVSIAQKGCHFTIHSSCSKCSWYASIPVNVEDLVIPQDYQIIAIHGEEHQFLRYDSEQTLLPGRMLIFSTTQNLNVLARSDKWYADGTFSVAPNLFNQMYTIHVQAYDTILPVVYVLLPNKTKATYRKLLQELKIICPGLQPTQLLLDFERAAIDAFTEEFPEIQVSGCFFHLTQSVWRKIQSVGLQVNYQRDAAFALRMRMLPALAFVPPAQVSEYFDILTEEGDYPQEAQEILDYFEKTYIGRRAVGVCKDVHPHSAFNYGICMAAPWKTCTVQITTLRGGTVTFKAYATIPQMSLSS